MNSQRQKINQQNYINNKKILQERKIWEMEEEIELLREQVESLKQLLCQENQLTNEYIQELAYTKQELEWMNEEIFNLIASKEHPLDKAYELEVRKQ